MANIKNKINIRRHWLDWCRLCANDGPTINVGRSDVYMKIISKVFDVEIGFEEPALGAMLCNECYSLIGDLIHYVDSVNKVQPIFELLRHTEPSEQFDVRSLRDQYGLSTNYKMEPLEEEIVDLDIQRFFDYQDVRQNSTSSIETPAKRKRGRPKGFKFERFNENTDPNDDNNENTEQYKMKTSIEVEPLSNFEDGVEEELAENHIWLEDVPIEDNGEIPNSVTKRKRGLPKQEEFETLECEDFDDLSQNNMSKSEIDADDLNLEQDSDRNESETDQIPIKKKRGRPKKNQVHLTETENLNESNESNCKNIALARLLLTSPQPEQHKTTNISNDNQNKKRSVTCHICHKKLSSQGSLKQHNERVHLKRKLVVCDICGKSVRSSSELKEHMLVHTDECPFVCPLCNASFKNQKRLKIHSQSHGTPKYECEICGKKLQTRANWNKHKYVHTNERRFKCTICGTATKHSTALKVHLLSHTGFRPYACKYCNKAFASGANCRDHKMKKHPEEFAKDDDKSSRIHPVPTLDELRALAEGMEKGARLRKPRSNGNEIDYN